MVYFHKKEVLLSLPFSSSFLLLLLLHYAFGQVGQLPPTERLSSATDLAALFALRSSLGVRSINWPRKADPCLAWNGVGCVAGRVVRLDLSGLRRTRLGRLSPRFAVDGLGNLTRLVYFNSTGFALPGPIPDWFGQRLGPLQILDLSSSSVFGSIPLSLGNLTQLTHLHLSGNALTGAIPESFALFSHLLELNLSHNSLYGSIPPTLATLQNLTILDLSANFFGDSIPPVLGTLASLQTLILANNSLIGSIPAQLGNLSLLVDLDLRFNSLTEAVPADLGGLSNLKRLMLGNNGLSGSLPANLFSSLTQLQFLVLGHNDFSGILPNRLWSLSKLKFIDISFNNFTGNLPDPSSTSNGSAAFFNLSNNFFYGSWPSQFERFNFIDLSGNYLEGTIFDVGNLNASYDLNCLQNASNQRSLDDCRSFYASRGLNFDGFGAPAPEPTQPSAPKRRTNRNLKFILIGVFGGLAFIALLVILVVLILRIQRRRGADQRGVSVNQVASGEVGSPSTGITINFSSLGEPFTYEQLLRATADFGDCNLIKKGHSGDLYQGILEGGTPIVVKRVDLKKFNTRTRHAQGRYQVRGKINLEQHRPTEAPFSVLCALCECISMDYYSRRWPEIPFPPQQLQQQQPSQSQGGDPSYHQFYNASQQQSYTSYSYPSYHPHSLSRPSHAPPHFHPPSPDDGLRPPGIDSYVPDPYAPHAGYVPPAAATPLEPSYAQLAPYFHDQNMEQHSWGVKPADPVGYAAAPVGPPNGMEQMVGVNFDPTYWNNQRIHHSAGGSTMKKGLKKTKVLKVVQSLWCELCNVECNSQDILDTHKTGKKHMKNLKKMEESKNFAAASALQLLPKEPTVAMRTPLGESAKVKNTKKRTSASMPGEDIETKKRKLMEGGTAAGSVRVCTICNVVCNSETVFNLHLVGQKHATMVASASNGMEPRAEPESKLNQNPSPPIGSNQANRPFANGAKKKKKKVNVVQSWCELCKIDCNSEDVLKKHILGKKHKKVLEKVEESKVDDAEKLDDSKNGTVTVELNDPEAGSKRTVRERTVWRKKAKTVNWKAKMKNKASSSNSGEDLDMETKKKLVESGTTTGSVRACSICNVVCNSETVYKLHLAGLKHATQMKKLASATPTEATGPEVVITSGEASKKE